MLKKILAIFSLVAIMFTFGVGANQAAAQSTKDRYDTSNLFVITMEPNVALYAEPHLDSLTLGIYPKGTMFVPINQQKDLTSGTIYNLVIRQDGAVGWVFADKVAITHK
jgi:hypothetical protein